MSKKKGRAKSGGVTLATIAAELNLSPATVSCVLSGRARELKIAEKTVERVLKTAQRLNYVPNEVGRSLRRQRSGIIGVIFGNLYFGWAQEVLEGIQAVLDPRGMMPFVAIHNWSIERERIEIRTLLQRRAEGVICMPLPGGEDNYAALEAADIPAVFLGDTLAGHEAAHFAAWDSGPAARTAVEHLIATGRRRIACIAPDHPTHMTQARLAAYQAALKAANLDARPEWLICESEDRSPEAMVTSALARLFAPGVEHPDALFFLNDGLAMPGLSVLKTMNIAVPDQVAVIGMGDIAGSGHAMIGLSTLCEPTREIGRQAAEIMLDLLEHPEPAQSTQRLVSGAQLMIRSSTGPQKG